MVSILFFKSLFFFKHPLPFRLHYLLLGWRETWQEGLYVVFFLFSEGRSLGGIDWVVGWLDASSGMEWVLWDVIFLQSHVVNMHMINMSMHHFFRLT